jgi:ADP-ribose pyrophosphatase YjhB (NUDIX family)
MREDVGRPADNFEQGMATMRFARATPESLLHIADEIRGIANLGRIYSTNEYDLDRYNRLLRLAAQMAAILGNTDEEPVLEHFQNDLYHITPICGVDAVVVRDGRLLLIRRHDNGLWAMPGGAMEIGETPAEACVRELEEETTIVGHATRLLGVFDSRVWDYRLPCHLVSFVFLVEEVSGEPTRTAEATDVDYFGPDGLPPLSPGHQDRVPLVFSLLSRDTEAPHFDERSPEV